MARPNSAEVEEDLKEIDPAIPQYTYNGGMQQG